MFLFPSERENVFRKCCSSIQRVVPMRYGWDSPAVTPCLPMAMGYICLWLLAGCSGKPSFCHLSGPHCGCAVGIQVLLGHWTMWNGAQIVLALGSASPTCPGVSVPDNFCSTSLICLPLCKGMYLSGDNPCVCLRKMPYGVSEHFKSSFVSI